MLCCTGDGRVLHVQGMPTLVPWVLVTRVLPTLRTVNMVGALMSYQSFLAKGSELRVGKAPY